MWNRSAAPVAATFVVVASGLLALTGKANQASAGPDAAVGNTTISAAALYQDRCSACHNLYDPKERAYSRVHWQAVVDRMLTMHHATDTITPAESVRIVQYLATFAPDPRAAKRPADPWATDSQDVWTGPPSSSQVFTFAEAGQLRDLVPAAAGAPPATFRWTASESGGPGALSVHPVRRQAGQFSMLVTRLPEHDTDADLRVTFRITSGLSSPAVGLVCGYQDPKRYYVLRFGQSHQELDLLKVDEPVHTHVQQTSLALGAAPLTIGPGWHTLRLLERGGTLRGWIDHNKRISTTDTSFTAGRVGLWVQGDTAAEFKNFEVDTYPPVGVGGVPAS